MLGWGNEVIVYQKQRLGSQTARTGKSVPKILSSRKENDEKAPELISEIQKFRLPTDPNHFYIHHRPAHRGRAHVTNAERDAVDAAASGEQQRAGRMMLMRTAKSCRSGAPMPASSLREAAQATVSNKPGHREEHEVSRKTIAQGEPD
jgi:hypothetical protein